MDRAYDIRFSTNNAEWKYNGLYCISVYNLHNKYRIPMEMSKRKYAVDADYLLKCCLLDEDIDLFLSGRYTKKNKTNFSVPPG